MTAPSAKKIGHDLFRSRIAGVDILRALAALSVLVYHARAEFWIGIRATFSSAAFSLDSVIALLLWPFSLGWLGVPIFFLLSGYCIHLNAARKLMQGKELQFRFLPYLRRRILRIYPVFFSALLFTAMLGWLQSGMDLADFAFENTWEFLLNLVMLQELLAPAFSFNTVLWTISIEFHLYLFYPIILWIIVRKGPLVALTVAAAISILTAVAYVVLDLRSAFIHAHGGSPLFTNHILIWVAGAYLAEVHVGRARLPIGPVWQLTWLVSMIVGIVLQIKGQWGVSPLFLAVGSLGAVEAIFHIIERYSLEKTLAGYTLEKIGLISYSLYATHRITFEALVYSRLADRHVIIAPAIGYSIIAIALALLHFIAIERLTLTRSPRTTR